MSEPQPLPLEARRAAWVRLWRILLSPPAPSASEDCPAPLPAEGSDGREIGGGQ